MKLNLQRLHPYCLTDPDFFDKPELLADRPERFPAADTPAPAGWLREEHGFWVSLRPAGADVPEQGWKVHVSAALADAARVCEVVLAYCVRRGIAVKMLRSRTAALFLSSKYADRASSGKLITIYPAGDAALARILPELSAELAGTSGAYILSDLRYGDSPVFVRYGAFVRRTVPGADGEPVYALRHPDGRLVPDERQPFFAVPDWVTVPPVLREAYEQWRSGDDDTDFPYEITQALHYSNAGGVYRARDTRTGAEVVLREARPHAGLDRDGADAVSRLHREHEALRQLQGLDCVPRLVEYRQAWEHHFLVEEYVEGTTLADALLARHPLVDPDPDDEARAAHAAWALEVTDRLARALAAVHKRGVRYGDLHPSNILLRPDGRVVLVDFELATTLDDTARPALGAPAFTPPPHLHGAAADEYLLDCIRLWLLLPLDVRPEQEPGRLARLVRAAEENFPLPSGFGVDLLGRLRPPHAGDITDRAGDLLAAERPDWPVIRDSLVAGLHACATPERRDRLFPGDPEQFGSGGTSLAHGAAGVLYALHRIGEPVPEKYTDWLVDAARRQPSRAGLYTGLHGVAWTLDLLGRTDEAREILDRARPAESTVGTAGLLGGWAGIGLALLDLGRRGRPELRDRALRIADGLAARWSGTDPGELPAQGGVFHGTSGVALLHLALYEDTGDPVHLDRAEHALLLDAARGEALANGTFQLVDAGRYLLNLDAGSGGVALVARHFLRHREQPRLSAVIGGVRRGCHAVLLRQPGLLRGRAGLITTLAELGDDPATLHEQVRRLAWHARSWRGHLAFPGAQLLRLSADLATGSAGILLALHAAFEGTGAVLPCLDPRSTAAPRAERR